MGAKRGTLIQRWARNVRITPTCWLWEGGLYPNGYGRIRSGPAVLGEQLAHRVAYERFVGPIPDGLHICHRCDIKNCVRPDHLFAGTRKDNMQDAVQKGRMPGWNAGKTICKHGHPLSGDNVRVTTRGKRRCRACDREWMRHHHRAGKAA